MSRENTVRRNRAKRWCFTINNYTEDDILRLRNATDHKYLVFGREIAPETGTRHIQGFIHLGNAKEFSSVKSLIGPTAHIERAKGTDKQNQTYCKKDGDFEEFGEPTGQGHRGDLEEITSAIVNGATDRELAENYPSSFVRYHRGFQAFRLALATPRTDHTKVMLSYNSSATAGSRRPPRVLLALRASVIVCVNDYSYLLD